MCYVDSAKPWSILSWSSTKVIARVDINLFLLSFSAPPPSLPLSLSLPQYSHTSPHDDWVVGDSGQVAPSRSSDVDSCNDGSWDDDDEDMPSRELEVRRYFNITLS